MFLERRNIFFVTKKFIVTLFLFFFFSNNQALSQNNQDPGNFEFTSIDNSRSGIINYLTSILPEDCISGGKIGASIIFITYDSMSCPHCAIFQTEILPELIAKYGDKVVFVHRDFPLDAASLKTATLLKCFDNQKANRLRYSLMRHQRRWIASKNKADLLDNVYSVVRFSDITRDTFDKCIDNLEVSEKLVQEKINAINNLRLNATPTHFINGKRYEGSRSVEYFTDAIETILEKETSNISNSE